MFYMHIEILQILVSAENVMFSKTNLNAKRADLHHMYTCIMLKFNLEFKNATIFRLFYLKKRS